MGERRKREEGEGRWGKEDGRKKMGKQGGKGGEAAGEGEEEEKQKELESVSYFRRSGVIWAAAITL